MQTSQLASAGGFPNAAGVDRRSPGTARIQNQDSPRPNFEQHMRRSVTGEPERPEVQNQTATEESGVNKPPAVACRAGSNPDAERGASSTRPEVINPASLEIVGWADEGQTGESDELVDADAQDEGAAGGGDQEPPQTDLVVAAGLVALASDAPVENATAKPAPVNDDNSTADSSNEGGPILNNPAAPSREAANQVQVEPDPKNTPARAGDALTEARIESSIVRQSSSPPARSAATNAAVQVEAQREITTSRPIDSTAATPVKESPAVPPGSGDRIAGQKISAGSVQAPVRRDAAEPAREVSSGRVEGSESKPASARGGESEVLRSNDLTRFQKIGPELPAVSPAMLRRAQPNPFDGTGAAKMDHRMDKRPEQNQFAGPAEQKLPQGGRSVPVHEVDSGAERALDSVGDSTSDRAGKAQHFDGETVGSALAGSSGIARAASVLSPDSANSSAGAVRTAEQLLQNMSREVAQFKHVNAESMAVVLRPDANTEIFLHMATRNGQIEIQARFERGDFTALNGQWSQLQQTLSQQGVRLGSLQEHFNQHSSDQQTGNSGWSHGQMGQHQQRQSRHDGGEGARLDAFEDVLSVSSRTPSPRPVNRLRKPTDRTTLEAWA